MIEPDSPDVTVVVATKTIHHALGECLKRLTLQADGRHVEIIVVDGSSGSAAETLYGHSSQIRLVKADPQWLVPRLWSVGIDKAKAPIVALTIGECLPDQNWIGAILQTAAEQGASAGFGGSIDAPRDGRWRDWAVYFSRYSAYMPPVENKQTMEIAGDNAAYRKSALAGCEYARSGFWENLVHRDLRKCGWKLSLAADMRVRLGTCPSAWMFCRERYLHGRYFGSTRPGRSLLTRLVRILTAPALAPFLVLRIGSRIAMHRRDWLAKYIVTLPWLVFFVCSWSAGETIGYMQPRSEEP